MIRSENLTGAVLMMASMAAFTANDTMMKSMAADVPLFQLIFVRAILTTLATGFYAWWVGALIVRLSRRDAFLVVVRTATEVGAAYTFLTGLFNMPIANAMAILQAVPIVITVAAALFLSEPVGWRRMLAIAVGFGGVVLIIRPGAADFNIYSLYVLAAVGFVTLRDLVSRQMSRETPTAMVTLVTSLANLVFFGLACLAVDWAPMGGRELALTAGAASMIIFGYVFSILVMRHGEVSFSATFRYSSLVWGLWLGWLVFGEWPDNLTLLGAAIVVGSGLFMLWREMRLGKRRPIARPVRQY